MSRVAPNGVWESQAPIKTIFELVPEAVYRKIEYEVSSTFLCEVKEHLGLGVFLCRRQQMLRMIEVL